MKTVGTFGWTARAGFLEGKWRPGTRGGMTLILHLDLDSLHGGKLVRPYPHYLGFVLQSKESPFPFLGKEDHLLVKCKRRVHLISMQVYYLHKKIGYAN